MIVIIVFILLMCICSVVCVTLGRYIASGNGDGLISGYGTAQDDEKDRYDIVKLRRVVSLSLYLVACVLPFYGVVAVLPEGYAMTVILVLTAVTILILLCSVVCGDRWARKK